jgi:UDP-4-amino-4,6-dideoxy-N-acetyl-beta-L-altrosamine N-acetyltransferase
VIVGKKVTLLPLDEIHLETVRSWINNPEVRAGTGTEGPVSSYEHRRWYEKLMRNDRRRAFIIGEHSEGSVSPVGLTGFNDVDVRARRAELWIYIGQTDARRKGLAAEATLLLLRHAFDMIGLHRVELRVMESNARAISLYRKLGFVEEGVARESLFHGGCFHNMLLFSMLESEFRGLPGELERCARRS